MIDGHPAEPFWYALPEPRRRALLDLGKPRSYEPGAIIMREGEQPDVAAVVLDGCVKVSTVGHHGYQAILGLRNGGDLVGELAVVDGGLRSATLTALTAVEALALPAAGFRRFLQEHPGVAKILNHTVTVRLREADRHRSAAGSDTVPQRLASLLLYLGARYGTEHGAGVAIDLPLSQQDLAGLVLTSQRTVGRVLEKWREEKLIVTGRRRLLLVSMDELRMRAAG